jgi:hypothetical protein
MFKPIQLTIFATLLSGAVFAQKGSIRIHVVDSADHQPLSFSKITLVNQRTGQQDYTGIASLEGNEVINTIDTGTYTIQVTEDGYIEKDMKDLRINPGDAKKIEIDMKMP